MTGPGPDAAAGAANALIDDIRFLGLLSPLGSDIEFITFII